MTLRRSKKSNKLQENIVNFLKTIQEEHRDTIFAMYFYGS